MTPPITAAQVTRVVLPNGLTCLVKPSRGSGAVALHGYVKVGSAFDAGRPGLARFVGSMLIRGTSRRTAQQIAEDLDAMGAVLSVASGIEATLVSARSLADDLPALLATAAEVLMEPAFPADEVEKVRGELMTAARMNALDTRQVAERTFRRLAYPEGHPYRQSPDGDEAVLAALAPDDLRAFHARHFRPEAAIMVVVGDVDPRPAVDLVAGVFEAWPAHGAWALPHIPALAQADGLRREEVVVPGKTQSDLALGAPGIARSDPDYYAVMIANMQLGQLGMMGRIGENVRERQGMAYYAHSDLRAGLLAGPWWVRAGVNPANVDRAVEAIVHEITQFQEQGPTGDELADARTFLIGSLAVRLETQQGMAQMLADMELYGLGLDYLERYPAIIAGVDRDAIVRAIRRFPADGYTLAVAGPERPA
jgi:zinc protease